MPWYIVKVDAGSMRRLRYSRDHSSFGREHAQLLDMLYGGLGVTEERTLGWLLWPDWTRKRMTLELTADQAACLLAARPPVFMETTKPRRKRKAVDSAPTLC